MTEAKKAVPPRPPPVEVKPVLAGRLWIAVAMLLGLGLVANPVFNSCVMRKYAPPEDIHTDFGAWREGNEADVRITVVTADSQRLSCANAKVVEGAHCAYGTDWVLWRQDSDHPLDDNGAELIQPYRTSPDNALVLVIGLWAQPEVAMRLHREPPNVIPVKRLQRFDVTCHVKFLSKLDTIDVRWETTGNWQTERNAWIVRPLSCAINNG